MKGFKISFFKWLVISVICIYFGFMVGKFKQDILLHKVQLLELDTTSLTTENTQLTERLNFIQAEFNAEREVHEVLKSENKELNKALDASNDKLYFYEQVVAPELSVTGLNVYSFSVSKGLEEGSWLYELVLMQAQQGRRELSGKVEITFADTDDTEVSTKDIKLSEIDPNVESAFKFQYFQTLKGSFTLPKDSKVGQVFVVAEANRTNWSRAQRIEKIYDWEGFIKNGGAALEELAIQAE
jgi:predicted nuclease with TOPRIM domain